ncbi:metallophosphoesterase [Rhodoblastus acidophilus]|uniref:Metallophosphoesterase n=1 Tax=Rhodoblastus acidophilus TaxID=1074 RepID=A0A6N8DGT7_RHOAC|nr:metallophosphoesterase family protein [Rhodoblastus acidophilus]MCW2272576.1 diadenosine tetraphosphatase ApaH/serine/threonine PP2A family protein phosphatase [Rhodoblastus acidophilus]MTV29490.1 metallophosphoesterase [Rhodoblastus acidophilus]
MLLALFTDIHGNREAFDACRAEARRLGAEKFVYLGDLVGYGADPAYVVERVAEDFEKGALCVMGNHDLALVDPKARRMYDDARHAVEFAEGQLDAAQKRFLADLPFTAQLPDGPLFVHADASAPRRFRYVQSVEDATISMDATRAPVTFCGHVHRPRLYHRSGDAPAISFAPTETPTPLARSRRWLATLGSVGQPRDGDSRAAFALFDLDRAVLSFHRVDYDVETASRKILRAGLAAFFAERLFLGR